MSSAQHAPQVHDVLKNHHPACLLFCKRYPRPSPSAAGAEPRPPITRLLLDPDVPSPPLQPSTASALLWLQQSSWSSSAVVIEIDASPTASLCLLCLRPLPRACLPRVAAFSQSNSFTCKQQLVPAMLLKRSCRAAQNACQPAASLVSPAAALLQEIVPASFPASSLPFLASLSPCHPVCSGR